MEDDPDFIRGCRDLAERRGGSLSPFIDAPAILFTSWDRVQRSQPDCFPWLSALESPLEVTRGSAQRCKSSCAVSNSSLWYLVLRHLAFRRRHSGFTFVRRCFSSSASSRFSMNCRRNMASTRSCRLADCFLRFPWLFLAPSISPPRRILRPSFHAGFPRIRFGSIWWALLFFARRSVLPFLSRHGWQRLWSE